MERVVLEKPIAYQRLASRRSNSRILRTAGMQPIARLPMTGLIKPLVG